MNARRWTLALLLTLPLLGGCGPEAVTADNFAASCEHLRKVSCTRFTDCLAPVNTGETRTRDQQIADCLADSEKQDGKCTSRYEMSPCRMEEKEATDRCAAEVTVAQCSALCSGKDFVFCWHPCEYLCPLH